MSRRRALMIQQGPTEPPNKFVEGTYSKGTSAWSVDSNGDVTFTAIKGGTTDNRPAVEMVRKIDFKTDDTVRLVVKKLSGSVSTSQFFDMWICGFKAIVNQSWGTGATPIDKTVTATQDAASVYWTMNNRTSTAQYTNYKVALEVYVNGTKVFPEV